MKTLATTLLAATLAMLSGWSNAGDDAEYGYWITVENQPCQAYELGKPDPENTPTVTWSGACVDGKISGRGRAVWRYPSGIEVVSEGKMRAGRLHGHGVLTVPG